MGRARSARVLCAFAVWSLAFSVLPEEAHGQFNARGRGAPKTPTKPSTKGGERAPPSPAVGAGSGVSSADAGAGDAAREEELIKRYRKLILEKPGEEVPLLRLTELLRARDGNLDALLQELRAQASGPDGYNAEVALAGILSKDGRPEECEDAAKKATVRAKDRAPAFHVLAACQLAQDKKLEARASQKQELALTRGPERTLLLRSLRDLSLDLDDLKVAREYHRLLTAESQGNLFQKGELGRELLRRGRPDLAVIELQEVVRDAHGDQRALAPALRDLGEAQMDNQQFDLAISTLEKASAAAHTSPGLNLDIESRLALAHRKRGTLQDYLVQLEKKPATPPRLELLGRLYEEEGEPEKAQTVYKKALASGGGSVDLRLRSAALYELSGDLEGATSQYREIVKQAPSDVPLSLRYMNLLLSAGHREQAVVELKRILARTERDPSATLLLLDFAEKLGETELSRSVLARLKGQGDSDPRFLVDLGSRYYRSGEEEKARAVWDRILNVPHRRAEANVIYGDVLLDHGHPEDGIKALRAATVLEPNNKLFRKSLALGLERASTTVSPHQRAQYQKEALLEWERLLALPGEPFTYDAQARRHLVRLVKKVGNLKSYVHKLEKAFAQKQPDVAAGRLLVEAYLSENQEEEATRVLERLVKMRPGDREALLQLVSAHERLGDEPKVIETLKRLVAADPKRAREYYTRMAASAERRGSPEEALGYAELSIKTDASDPLAQMRLGDLYLSLGRPDDATRAYRAALSLDDRLSAAYFKLSDLARLKNQNDEAMRLLFPVIRSEPSDELVRQAARRALALGVPLGKEEEIESLLRPLAISQPERPAYRELYFEVLSAQTLSLITRVAHDDGENRTVADTRLRDLCRRSSGLLLSGLLSESAPQRELAIQLLPFGDSASSESALYSFARGDAPIDQRRRALLAIGRTTSPLRTKKLQELLAEEKAEAPLTQAALWVLARKSAASDPELFLSHLDSPYVEVATQAALGLGTVTPPSARKRVQNALGRVLSAPGRGPETKAASALSLASLGPLDSALSLELSQTAESSLPLVSSASLIALSLEGETALAQTAVARAYLRTTGEQDPVLLFAAQALAARERAAERGGSPDAFFRSEPARFGELGAEQQIEAHVEDLVSEVDSTSAGVRHHALFVLQEALKTETKLALVSSSRSAESALSRLSHARGQPLLLPFLTQNDLEEPASGGLELAQKASAGIFEAATAELRLLSETPHLTLRQKALLALHPGLGEWAREALERGLESEDDALFQAALQSLVLDRTRPSAELLGLRAEAEENWIRRRRLTSGLGALFAAPADSAAEGAAKQALSALKTDKNALVREEAEQALSP